MIMQICSVKLRVLTQVFNMEINFFSPNKHQISTYREFEKASMCFYMRRASTRDNTVAMTRQDVLSSFEISQQLLIDEPAEKLTRARGACLTPFFSLSKTN